MNAAAESASSRDGESACPNLEALESFMRGESCEEVLPHVVDCPACQEQLKDMRSANEFLERFASASGAGSPSRPRQPHSLHDIKIEGYEIRAMLAFGGQGAVYKARQIRTGRLVAIKVPFHDALSGSSGHYRFKREIELTARLNHPNIVRVLGACDASDGRLGCVMEYIEGEPIGAWAEEQRRRGRSGLRRIVEVMHQVADAIAYAHQRAILHRDIKPSNIMITADDVPHVLDFGLAKALDSKAASFATVTGAFIGTLVYSAPEQLSGAADAVDLRTDVYSLGLLLFHVLTGRLPFPSDAPAIEIMRSIRDTAPGRPSSLNSEIGAELDAITLKAISKEKDRRYTTGGELRDDLRAWLAGEAVRAKLDSRSYRLRKTISRNRWKVTATAAATLVLLSLLVLGVIAREQSNRALLAETLRQARALESHWVRLAEARLLSRDSFEAGENVAWQALLDPEQALVDEQIEGVGGDGPLSTSPAYWALWEMYMRMPIVASLPLNMPNSIALSEDGFLIAARDRAIEVWEWQTGRLADRLELPIAGVAYSFTYAVGLDTLLVVDTAGPPLLVDLKAGTSVPLGSEPVAAAMTGGACVALSALNDAGVRVEIWDVSTRPPSRTVAVQLADMHFAACFDPAGRFMTVAEVTGRVRVFNTVDGRVLLDRSPAESPRFNRLLSRGRADEVILVGPAAWAVLQLGEQPVVWLEEDRFRNLNVQNAPKNAWPSRAGKRYIFLTDRWQLGISGANDDEIQGRIVPGLSLRGAALTADDRYVAVLLEGSHRCMLLEAEQAQPRPLVHATDAAIFGRATVFDVVFSPDSRSLYTASMDGTVRRYETRGDAVEIVSRQPVPGGATRLALHGDDLLVGSHDEGRGDARILRYHADGAVEELLSGQNWICGVIGDDNGIVWALSGGGVLFRVDLESGERRAVSLQRPTRRVGYIALAHLPEANLLLLATNNRIDTMLLDANTLEEMGPPLNLGSVRQFAVSPTEPSLFATADDDGCIRIWRFTSGQAPKVDLVRTLRAHAGSAFCIAFHPGGRLIASGGGSPESKDVRIWDSLTGQELAALDLFEVGVFDLEFSPDGRFLAAGGEADPERVEEGPQLFLIDMKAADTMIAGNLEYHIRRLTPDSGREPAFAEAMRSWAAKIRSDSAGPPTVEH